MIHNEHLRKADETYEIRHDNNGNAIHIIIKDGNATVYPTLHDLVSHQYFGKETTSKYISEGMLEKIYGQGNYNYYNMYFSLVEDIDGNLLSVGDEVILIDVEDLDLDPMYPLTRGHRMFVNKIISHESNAIEFVDANNYKTEIYGHRVLKVKIFNS